MNAQGSSSLSTGAVALANNYAFNPEVRGMPAGDFSVELWARTPAHPEGVASNAFQTLLSYATHTKPASSGGACEPPTAKGFLDEMIRDSICRPGFATGIDAPGSTGASSPAGRRGNARGTAQLELRA